MSSVPVAGGRRVEADVTVEFVHDLVSPRVVFGSGTLGLVASEATRLGAARVLLISGSSAREAAGRVAVALGPRLAGRIGEVAQHVPDEVARRAVATAGQARADLLIAVGGGSAIGTAKAVARELAIPVLAVPTTYSGSEMTTIWGQTSGGRKRTGRDPRVLPRTVIYDPLLTLGMPPGLTAVSGLNALAHAVEGLQAPDRTPLLEYAAAAAVRLLASALPRCTAAGQETQARGEALRGAWLAGLTLANTSMGLHHRLAHVLGGGWELPHGEVHAVLLPQVVAATAAVSPGGLAGLAGLTGPDGLAAGLWDLARALGAPASLRSLGFPDGAVAAAAAQAVASPLPGPAPVTKAIVADILRAALAGARPAPAAMPRRRDHRRGRAGLKRGQEGHR